ncbi:MAG TPA: ABC transporter permease [Casimicrobiaceae bacterium]|nr:ABC transporter permease [Casimicrobiaceae bacterium]
MAVAAYGVDFAAPARAGPLRVWALRAAIVAVLLAIWEIVARSGWLFQDVVPTLPVIARAVVRMLSDPAFYQNLKVTAGEIAAALAIGGIAGMAIGLGLGTSRFLSRAYEAFIYYLGPTPKIIFFPIMILWFGTGPGSKIAMGALSCFFPIVISVAAGIRQIAPVLIRVGRSFRASPWQMTRLVYLPAMRTPVVNGFRLGLGIAIIGTLLAETKLSNQGLGYLIIQSYATFDMPRMYALLIVLFVLAIALNALLGRYAARDRSRPNVI